MQVRVLVIRGDAAVPDFHASILSLIFFGCKSLFLQEWKSLTKFLISGTATVLSMQTHTCEGVDVGLTRLRACRHASAAQRLGFGENQTAAKGNRALGNEQRLQSLNGRREVRTAQKARRVVCPGRNGAMPAAGQMFPNGTEQSVFLRIG